jgi:hypothetical protein
MRKSRGRVGRRRACEALFAVLAALAAPAAPAASPDELADAAAKAEYAFFTEDRRALERLTAGIAGYATSSDPAELYAVAHAEFRLLQLASRAHATAAAASAGEACLAALARRADLHRDAEGLALEAACAGYLAGTGRLARLTAGHRRDASLAAARELAAHNPRVELVGALSDWFGTDASPAARERARAGFARAAADFDTIGDGAPGAPAWGAAEAWLFVGHGLVAAGDLLGARSAYERALLVAPDFAAARRALARLAAPR